MAWRPAKSLDILLAQVNATYPSRNKSSDGTIGDERHQATHSEHNPDENGVVRARDITDDPAHGLVSRKLAEALVASRDPRILYVISNREICSSAVNPWVWRSYNGTNPHEAHMHLSVVADPKLYDDMRPWSIGGTAPVVVASSRFEACLKPLLEHEGGNDDDAQDMGGRTSRGILQTEYDAYRSRNGLARRDVWTASDAEVREIYKTEYWDVLHCDELPAGVDYAVFDFGVNSGVGRSAKELQKVLGVAQDGKIGPITIKAAASMAAKPRIEQMCDDRLAYLRGLSTWPRFGRGGTTRVQDVRKLAIEMAGSVGKAAPTPVTPAPAPATSWWAKLINALFGKK